MSRLLIAVIALVGVLATMASEPLAPKPKALIFPKDHVIVELIDGSRYVGKLSNTVFTLKTAFGELQVPVEHLSFVDLKDGNDLLRLRNEDRISGALKRQEFEIETVVGKLRIPVGKVAKAWPRSLGMQHASAEWGDEVDGLRMRLLCDKRKVRLGETLELALEIKNFGKKTQMIEYPALPYSVSDDSSEDLGGYPIRLKIKRLSPDLRELRKLAEEMRRLRSPVSLRPGKTLTVHMDLRVDDRHRLRRLQKELAREVNDREVTDVSLDAHWIVGAIGKFSIEAWLKPSRHAPQSTQRKTLKAPAIEVEVTR